MDLNPTQLQGPVSESLYFEPQFNRVVRIYGDNHDEIGNYMKGNPIEDDLLFQLDTKPQTKVFGEFNDNPDTEYKNPHLTNLSEYYNFDIGNHRTRKRLVNTDEERNEILDLYDNMVEAGDEDATEEFLDNVDSSFEQLGGFPELIGKTERERQRIMRNRERLRKRIQKEPIGTKTSMAEEFTGDYALRLLDAEMLKHIREQPANTNYIFYVGDGHKDEIDRILPIISPEKQLIFKNQY